MYIYLYITPVVLLFTWRIISYYVNAITRHSFYVTPRRQDWEPPCFFGCGGLLRTRQIRANEVNPGYAGVKFWSRGVFLGYKVDLWSVASGKTTNYHIAMEHPWEKNHQNGGFSRAMLVTKHEYTTNSKMCSILGVSKRDYPDTFEAHVNFRPAT